MNATWLVAALVATAPLTADVASIRADYQALAADAMQGRATGTAGYDKAAAHVAERLAAHGASVSLQPVPYRSAMLVPGSAKLSIDGRELEWKTDFTMGADLARTESTVTAPLVFVGYGISAPAIGHDDYAGIDVRGKIVVRLSGAPKSFSAHERAYYAHGRQKAAAAVAAGAVGVIGLRNAYSVEHYEWDMVTRNAGARPSLDTIGADGTLSRERPELIGGASLSEDAAAGLFDGAKLTHAEILAADAAGEPLPAFALGVSATLVSRSEHTEYRSPNVVGVIPGSDPALAGEFVVFSAHLDGYGIGTPVDGDAIYNGAYDNAIGIAILLETARLFAAMDEKPRRSLAFVAVGGEENGLLGSDYYARHPTVDGRMAANINFDMPLFTAPVTELIGYGAALTSLGALTAQAAAAEGFTLVPDPRPDEVIFVRSDHYSFARQGVPALFLTTAIDWSEFLKTHYHSPSDDLAQTVDWPSVQRFVQVNARVALEAANADAPPRWLPGNLFTERFGSP